MQSSHLQWLRNAANYILDNIFDVLTIAAVAYIFIRHRFQPYTADDIALLAGWILAVLALTAVSDLRQRHRHWKSIEELSRETHDLVAKRLSGPARAKDFFWPDGKAVTAQDLSAANDIYVVGMVLTRTVRDHATTFRNRLAAGANLRFIILDWKVKPLMETMPRRSFESDTKKDWQERTSQTARHIQDIPDKENNVGTLKLGYLPYFPSFGMWLIDPDEPHGKIHVEVYHHRTSEPNATFSLHAAEDPHWYRFFRKQFDVLWTSCIDNGEVLDIVPPPAQAP